MIGTPRTTRNEFGPTFGLKSNLSIRLQIGLAELKCDPKNEDKVGEIGKRKSNSQHLSLKTYSIQTDSLPDLEILASIPPIRQL